MGCALLSVCGLYCYASDLTDDYYDIAKNYYKEGNKEKALEYVEQILKIEENNIDALGLKIKLTPPASSKKLPNIDKPLIFDVPYVSTGNTISDEHYKQGLAKYRAKDYSSAQMSLQSSVSSNPNNYRAYNTLGLVYWAENKLELAKEAFEKSNSLNQTFTIPLDNLAQIYKQTGESTKNLSTLLKAKSLNPKDFCAVLLLGDYYKDNGNFTDALKCYREVVQIKPDYNLAYLKIAQTRADDIDLSGSNATLNYYSKLNPNDDYSFYMMANNYLLMNDYTNAKISVYKAISMNNCREYRELLGKINYQNEDYQEALDSFLSSLSSSSSSEIYNYVGMCYYNLHDFNKAIININKAITMPDTRVIYYYNLAQVYYTLKDGTNYMRYMSLVRDFQPLTCQDYIDMSGILLDSESKNSAIIVLNKGIEKYPKVKELYLEKLKIYDLTKDFQGMGQTKLEIESVFK